MDKDLFSFSHPYHYYFGIPYIYFSEQGKYPSGKSVCMKYTKAISVLVLMKEGEVCIP